MTSIYIVTPTKHLGDQHTLRQSIGVDQSTACAVFIIEHDVDRRHDLSKPRFVVISLAYVTCRRQSKPAHARMLFNRSWLADTYIKG